MADPVTRAFTRKENYFRIDLKLFQKNFGARPSRRQGPGWPTPVTRAFTRREKYFSSDLIFFSENYFRIEMIYSGIDMNLFLKGKNSY